MNVCVFCGSSAGRNPEYSGVARELGRKLALAGHTLVYGGGNIGLMGILADSMLSSKGKVIGIIPGFLMEREVGHSDLSRIEVVQTMHERKQRMAELSNVVVVLPGGIGTLDETAEILTWRQLGLIRHNIGFLNTSGYYDTFIRFLKEMGEEGFLSDAVIDQIKISDNVDDLFVNLAL